MVSMTTLSPAAESNGQAALPVCVNTSMKPTTDRSLRDGRFSLRRHPANPLIVPDLTSPWECVNVFNPSVIYHNGLFHMHYRAEGTDWVSRIGYAVSVDGVQWNRFRDPVMVPEHDYEVKGVQDPRVTEIEGRFYMAYTGWAPYREGIDYCGNIYPCWAVSDNLVDWEKLGPMVRGEDNKDHMLFPRKIAGQFVSFHRRRPDVWLAKSDDLTTWRENDMSQVLGSRSEFPWEGKYVGMNGTPIETADGWLAFYHAADAEHVYRIGAVLLDLDDPSRVVARTPEPIFWPEEVWEVRGDVDNVVFSSNNMQVGDEVWMYYGGGDHVIALATAGLDEVLEKLERV
jgi:predicted GH43/DUF377 family glycosyl hydrolase